MLMMKLIQGTYLGTNRRQIDLGEMQLIDTVYSQPVFNGWHHHQQAHLTFVLNGGNLEKRQNSENQLSCGSVIFYHSYEEHRNDHTLFPSRNINLELADHLFSSLGVSEADICRSVQQGSLGASTLIRMMKSADEPWYREINTGMILADAVSVAKRFNRPPVWISHVKNLLYDRWYEQPTLQQLAAEVGVYPTTISKYFIRYFGCTLGAYLRRLKVERAIVLICRQQHSLSEIAHLCGFADQSHFIRSFKSETGYLPKAFGRY